MDSKQGWKCISLSEENVDTYIKGLYDGTKEQEIQLGVYFDKDDHNQMDLLRQALLETGSFSGLCKQLLINRFFNKAQQQVMIAPAGQQGQEPNPPTPSHASGGVRKKKKRIGGSAVNLGAMLQPNPDAIK